MKTRNPNQGIDAQTPQQATSPRLATLVAIALLACVVGARAQSFAVGWYTLDGGGGTSTGGVFSISGTVGQPDAAFMSGGNFILAGGFWSVAIAIQTEGAPRLSITNSGNGVTLSWPSPSTGFVLQQNSALGTTNWSNVATAPSDNGTNKTVTVSPPIGDRFNRLAK